MWFLGGCRHLGALVFHLLIGLLMCLSKGTVASSLLSYILYVNCSFEEGKYFFCSLHCGNRYLEILLLSSVVVSSSYRPTASCSLLWLGYDVAGGTGSGFKKSVKYTQSAENLRKFQILCPLTKELATSDI